MNTQNIKISKSDNREAMNFCSSHSVFNPENFSISGNQSLSFSFSVLISSISRSFLDCSSIISRLILDHFSIAARLVLDHRSLYRTCSLVVASMYRRSGCTQILLNILTNIPYGFFKPIPQYFPRPPD